MFFLKLTSEPLLCRRLALALAALASASGTSAAVAQRVLPQPVTDSSTQASPLTPVPRAPASDRSVQASPVSPGHARGPSIEPHTAIPVTLTQGIDSGKLKQGQDVPARLSGPVSLHGGATLPAGTPVVLTAVESVPAGRIMAMGELSLQVVRVANVGVFTDTLVFQGKPGHQDLPDSAPALGTDAGLPAGAPLVFHVQLPPASVAAALPDRQEGPGPGSVDGIASGSPPPASSLKSTFDAPGGAGSGNTPAQQQRPLSPGNTTTNQQTQQAQQPGVAPNQPQSPAQTAPTRPQ